METLAQLHMDLIRVLCINDVDGYINILPAIIEIFFGLNRPKRYFHSHTCHPFELHDLESQTCHDTYNY